MPKVEAKPKFEEIKVTVESKDDKYKDEKFQGQSPTRPEKQ
jgi:hypothetical protein